MCGTSEKKKSCFIAELFTKQRMQKCPLCGRRTKRIHGYCWQRVQGPAFTTNEVQNSLRKRRYLCTSCRHKLYERLLMIYRYQRCMASVQMTAMMHAVVSFFRTVALVTGVKVNRVLRWFDQKVLTTVKCCYKLLRLLSLKAMRMEKDFNY